MYANKRAVYHLKEGLELLKCGRVHQGRYFIQVAVDMMEQKQKPKPEAEQPEAGEAA